jgi:hypothetical protein
LGFFFNLFILYKNKKKKNDVTPIWVKNDKEK